MDMRTWIVLGIVAAVMLVGMGCLGRPEFTVAKTYACSEGQYAIPSDMTARLQAAGAEADYLFMDATTDPGQCIVRLHLSKPLVVLGSEVSSLQVGRLPHDCVAEVEKNLNETESQAIAECYVSGSE